jgi:hypothetical protein
MTHSYPRQTPRLAAIAVTASFALYLLACTTVGAGSASDESSNAPVTFVWTNKETGISGTMRATIAQTRQSGASGDAFSSPFL